MPTWPTRHKAKAELERKLILLLFGMVQAVTSAPPEKIDLTIRQPCEAQKSSEDEVVVCARRGEGPSRYRVNQPPTYQSHMQKAEVQLADGVAVSGETENVDVGGFPSNRFMARLKIKF